MSRYLNRCFKELDPQYGPEFYETDETPVDYNGFKIYRIHASRFDLVIDSTNGPVCQMQMAGMSAAKKYIDDFWARENAA